MEREAFKQIDEYSRKLQEDPKSLVFLALSEIYLSNGLIDEALEVCKRGLNIHPELARVKLLLAKIYLSKSLIDESVKILNDVISKDNGNIMAHNLLLSAYEKSGKQKEAEEEKKKLENLATFGNNNVKSQDDNQDEVVTPTLAELYVKQGLYDEAIRVYKKIVEVDPLNDIARERINNLKKEKEEAKSLYKKRMKDTIIHMKKTIEDLQESIKKIEEEIDSVK